MANINTNDIPKKYTDGMTKKFTARMYDCEDYIYNIEDGVGSFEENRRAIVEYLSSCDCGMSLGLELRRYICKEYATAQTDSDGNVTGYIIGLPDGRELSVGNYAVDGYDITTEDIRPYTDAFMGINAYFNSNEAGELVSDITRAEASRLLKIPESVRRDKIFKICFALHMSEEDAYLFLTKYLCERTYNYRSPDEAIAYYCFAHKEVNNYPAYLRMKTEYERRAAVTPITDEERKGFTLYAERAFKSSIVTEEELYDFLLSNRANFNKFSQTAFAEYTKLYEKIKKKPICRVTHGDTYLEPFDPAKGKRYDEYVEDMNDFFEYRQPENPEQMAKAMLTFIPRISIEKKDKNGNVVTVNDFVSVKNSGDHPTNDLPNAIVSNLMVSDRINDLLKQKKAVERKDLVFMKFFLFFYEISETSDEVQSAKCYNMFIDECNDMLHRSGYSELSPLNKYENLILLSLVSDIPFEMFGMIIENSFFDYSDFEEDGE